MNQLYLVMNSVTSEWLIFDYADCEAEWWQHVDHVINTHTPISYLYNWFDNKDIIRIIEELKK